MTEPLPARLLAHLHRIARQDKRYAWWAAKNYADMLPDLSELPAQLTALMRGKNPENHTTNDGGAAYD